MLRIRLLRIGKKNQPSFKIVVTDKRNPPKGGRFKEEVGFYNPLTKEKILKKDRIQFWLEKGAQPSATVHNLLVEGGIIKAKKIPVHKKATGKGEGEKTVSESAAQNITKENVSQENKSETNQNN
jgi:small subunit ribosomal protein S16